MHKKHKAKVGIIAEDSNDYHSISKLLKQGFPDVQFVELIKSQRGSQLDSLRKMRTLLKSALDRKGRECSYIILVRDLDHESFREKRMGWFREIAKISQAKETIPCLLVLELEALILADIQALNRKQGVQMTFSGNPEKQENPKEYLSQKMRIQGKRFSENDNPLIFSYLNLQTILNNHASFREFFQIFQEKMKNI